MGIIKFKWNNAAILASINTTGQRASKRIKAIGGAYDATGFTPANDMAKAIDAAQVTVLSNRVYEVIVEALCISGGPTPNDNGPIEAIDFACILPSFDPTHNAIDVVLDLTDTDISKIRVKLRKQLDNTLVGTFTASRVSNAATATFTGLTASTAYWVEIEFYAVVNGVEVISSDAFYLGSVCGTNITAYQVATTAPPACPAPTDLEVVYIT